MQEILEILKSEYFLLGLAFINIIMLFLFIYNSIKLKKIRKEYLNFVKKLGNGNNIDELLKVYLQEVENVKMQNKEICDYCEKLDTTMENCIQKVGMVRYNAFQDTGSNLSFAVAFLDEKNCGIVLNGIYTREGAHIYAKSVEEGKSTYTLSEEEKEAIQKATGSKQ